MLVGKQQPNSSSVTIFAEREQASFKTVKLWLTQDRLPDDRIRAVELHHWYQSLDAESRAKALTNRCAIGSGRPMSNKDKQAGVATSSSGASLGSSFGGFPLSSAFDANGNMTCRGGFRGNCAGGESFSHDQANRLTRVSSIGFTATSTYDGDGKRLSQTTNSTTTHYV